MEKEDSKQTHKKVIVANGFSTEIPAKFMWHKDITIIDLSAGNIDTLDEKVQLPANLVQLNLSYNKLLEVPAIVSKLEKLKRLNLSHNAIEYFDETPSFCHTLEWLDLSTNSLLGLPCWIWTEKPKNLTQVNLSCNTNITKSFINGYLEELLQYKTVVLEIDLHNCGYQTKHIELLATFPNAKTIIFGTADYSYHGANIVSEIPNIGLEKCCDIERLDLSNTRIYTINSGIDILKNLSELNLACNNISNLPNEFCNLTNLETCVLSNNEIIYLPDNMHQLEKLTRLCLDCNMLCMLPEKLLELPSLKVLDLYDNCLYEISEEYYQLEEFDVALNYMDEPDDVDYLEKKDKLRLLYENRCDGRKPEVIKQDSEHSSIESDEDYYKAVFNGESPMQESPKVENDDRSQRSSSPEDWDSDAHWIPHDIRIPPTSHNTWVDFIRRKMNEGNFCPVDAHVVSVSEKVMYERKLNPQVDVELVGQFDDYSSDDS